MLLFTLLSVRILAVLALRLSYVNICCYDIVLFMGSH